MSIWKNASMNGSASRTSISPMAHSKAKHLTKHSARSYNEGPTVSRWSPHATAKCPNAGAMRHWVVHDLRTTFSTLACDILLADVAVVDRILNHVASVTTAKVRRVYNRSEMFEPRKAVLEQWADLVVRKVIS
jgi:integrase